MHVNIQTVKQAQSEQNIVVADQRVALLKSIDDLASIGGSEDHLAGLRRILEAFPEGILLSSIQATTADAAAVSKAKKVLLDSGEIEEEPKGRSFFLKLKTKPAAE